MQQKNRYSSISVDTTEIPLENLLEKGVVSIQQSRGVFFFDNYRVQYEAVSRFADGHTYAAGEQDNGAIQLF